jgi:hypothetical protein
MNAVPVAARARERSPVIDVADITAKLAETVPEPV